MDDKEKEMKAWEEYTGKANNFADWFTAILISNFAYLINLLSGEIVIGARLEHKVYLWNVSFYAACIALGSVFFVKALGVWAASERVHHGLSDFQKNIECARIPFIFIFGLCGIVSLVATGCILRNIFHNSL